VKDGRNEARFERWSRILLKTKGLGHQAIVTSYAEGDSGTIIAWKTKDEDKSIDCSFARLGLISKIAIMYLNQSIQ